MLVLVAALIVLFLCPSTNSMAGDRGVTTPTVSSKPLVGDNPAATDTNDEDDGDADGLSGFQSKRGLGGSQQSTTVDAQWVLLKQWWTLFIWMR